MNLNVSVNIIFMYYLTNINCAQNTNNGVKWTLFVQSDLQNKFWGKKTNSQKQCAQYNKMLKTVLYCISVLRKIAINKNNYNNIEIVQLVTNTLE